MHALALLLAQASTDKLTREARSWFAKLVGVIETYWYISIPAGFLGCFLLIAVIARWKMSR